MKRRTPPILLAVAVPLVLLVAGCGSSPQPSGSHPTTSPTPSISPVPPAGTNPPTAAPTLPGTPVPPGFVPHSVTFVSLQTGWVLGVASCPTGSCLALLLTSDAGHTWVAVPAPATPYASDSTASAGVHQVRFADPLDGWVFGPELWATHDGAATWTRVSLPGGSAKQVVDLAAAGATVHTAVFDGGVHIDSSPADHDAWSTSPTSIPFGAGPIPRAHLALHGGAGWLIEVDRTVEGGARLSGGTWSQWTPPCSKAGGDAQVDPTSEANLFAVCNEGVWFNGPPATHAYTSTDGGTSFISASATLPIGMADELASASPTVAVVAGHSNGGDVSELLLSTNAGSSWAPVYKVDGTNVATDLGFTSADQGVVVEFDQGKGSGSLLMTFDGGHTWNPVKFT